MKKNERKMTISEASDFFDEHDIFEFKNVAEAKGFKFDLGRKKYIGLDDRLFQKIKRKAKKLHVKEDDLIRDWLLEKV